MSLAQTQQVFERSKSNGVLADHLPLRGVLVIFDHAWPNLNLLTLALERPLAVFWPEQRAGASIYHPS